MIPSSPHGSAWTLKAESINFAPTLGYAFTYLLCHVRQSSIRHHSTVATAPVGGDASMRYLAASQEEEMARLKDTSPPVLSNPDSTTTSLSRGRDGYSRLGVLRTKPGRADSPSTLCMSCSDKIAAWNVHGIQGALGSYVLLPLYIDAVVIGDVPSDDISLRQMIQDCERAFWDRVAIVSGIEITRIDNKDTETATRRPAARICRA